MMVKTLTRWWERMIKMSPGQQHWHSTTNNNNTKPTKADTNQHTFSEATNPNDTATSDPHSSKQTNYNSNTNATPLTQLNCDSHTDLLHQAELSTDATPTSALNTHHNSNNATLHHTTSESPTTETSEPHNTSTTTTTGTGQGSQNCHQLTSTHYQPMLNSDTTTNETTTGTGQGSQNCHQQDSIHYQPMLNPYTKQSHTTTGTGQGSQNCQQQNSIHYQPMLNPYTKQSNTTTGTGQGSQNCHQQNSTQYQPISNPYRKQSNTTTGMGQGSQNCHQQNSTDSASIPPTNSEAGHSSFDELESMDDSSQNSLAVHPQDSSSTGSQQSALLQLQNRGTSRASRRSRNRHRTPTTLPPPRLPSRQRQQPQPTLTDDAATDDPIYASGPNAHWGPPFRKTRPPHTERIVLANVNGLGNSVNQIEIFAQLKAFDGTIYGITETHLDSTDQYEASVPPLQLTLNRVWPHTRLVLADCKDPDRSPNSLKKYGGVMQITTGATCSRIRGAEKDPVLGRWVSQLMILGNGTRCKIYTCYRVCTSSVSTAGSLTAYMQQWRMGSIHDIDFEPRKQFMIDFTAEIKKQRDNGFEILIMGDFNTEISHY